MNLCLKEYAGRRYLKEALIGRQGADDEKIHPGPRTYDGSYTELNLKWRGIEVVVQSATEGDDLVLLVTPLASQKKPALLVVEAGYLEGPEKPITTVRRVTVVADEYIGEVGS